MKPGRFLTGATVVLLTLIWGTTWSAISIGLRGVPPFTGVALRFGIASLVLLAIAPFARVRFGRAPNERRLWFTNAILSFGLSYGFVYWSAQWVPSGLVSVLWSTFPLFLAVLAHFFVPGERMVRRSGLGLALGFVGIAVIFSEDFSRLGGPKVALASVVLLGSPLAAAISNVFIKNWGKGVHPISLSSISMGLSAVMMGAVAATVERGRPVVFDRTSVSALLYLAVFGSAAAFGLYYWLMRHNKVTKLALIAYGVPVIAVFVGAVFLNEPVTGRMIAGSAFVVSGVALATYS